MRLQIRRRFWPVLFGLLLCTALPAFAQQAWPDRPVRVVVPYAAGGATDAVTRAFADSMARKLGQPIVVENRAGGGTNIAAALVAKAPPDGHTLLVTNIASNVLNRALYRRLDYDPASFAHAGMMARSTMCLVVAPNFQARSLAELVTMARQRPNGLTYASNGIGTPTHLLGEMLRQRTGLPLTHVPYGGSAQSNLDLLAGRVDFMFDACTLANSGQLHALAVTFPERWPGLPNVPAMVEQGMAGMELTTFFGLAGPRGTPEAALARLEAAIAAAAAEPEVVQRFAPTGFIPFVLDRAQTAEFLRRETENWTRVIRAAEISLD